MGAERVAIMVLSSAPRKTPTYIEPRVIVRWKVEGGSARTVSS